MTMMMKDQDSNDIPPDVIHILQEEQVEGVTEQDSDGEHRRNKNRNNTNKAVNWLRWLLVLVLVTSAITVAVLVYLYTSGKERDAFETQYESDSDKLLQSIGRNFDGTMAAADDFMYRVIYQARSGGATWPKITIPGLAVQASKLMSQTNSIYMAFYPLIQKEERADWENFTAHNDDWVEEALRVQAKDPNFHGPILTNYSISHSIWRNEGPEPDDAEGPFLPSWMGSPVIPFYYPYNWNALAYPAFSRGLQYSMKTKSVVVTPVANNANPDDPEAVMQAQTTSDWAIPYLAADEDPNEPFSDMYYPILDTIDEVVMDTTGNNSALGNVAFSFYWRHTLKNILPTKSRGLIIVFTNPCGDQSFTYQVDGSEPTFLGFGDLHSSKFESHSKISTLAALTNQEGTYTGVPMSPDFCPFTVTVYPSSYMESQFVTHTPVIMAVGSGLIFVFVAALFVAYDFLMRREFHTRQRLLEVKRHLMKFVRQEVQRPLNTVCQHLSLLQAEMHHAVPMVNDRSMHHYSNFLLDDCNVNQRTHYLEDDADHLRAHLQGWIQMTQQICHNAENSVDALTDLLNYDKLQEKSTALDLAVLSLNKVVMETSREFWLSARKKNVRYTVDNQLLAKVDGSNKSSNNSKAEEASVSPLDSASTSPSLQQSNTVYVSEEQQLGSFQIVGDKILLTQILRNLVANALKWTPAGEGSSITIRIGWEPLPKERQKIDKYTLKSGVEVALKRQGMARIDVIDTGKGMSEEQLSGLFRDGKMKDVEAGHGLGLFISKGMAVQHGGDLTASSEGVGKGSTFTLELPLYRSVVVGDKQPTTTSVDGSLKLPTTTVSAAF